MLVFVADVAGCLVLVLLGIAFTVSATPSKLDVGGVRLTLDRPITDYPLHFENNNFVFVLLLQAIISCLFLLL